MEKPKRKAISKKLRFDVFKRDSFTCVYCGQSPPAITLEVDHVEPVASGGENDINNLVTACFDCNRGKRDISLGVVPKQLADSLEILKEKELQVKEYTKFVRKIQRKRNKDTEYIAKIFEDAAVKINSEYIFSESFKQGTVERFLKLLLKDQVEKALYIAIDRFPDCTEQTIRYFCGICWNRVNGKWN